MDGAMEMQAAKKRLWGCFTVAAVVTALVWGVAWVWARASELDERCMHRLVGESGPFSIERSSLPPQVSCVYQDGTVITSSQGLVWIFWGAAAFAGLCLVCAIGMEISAVRFHRGSRVS